MENDAVTGCTMAVHPEMLMAQPTMNPPPGERLLRFVGDRIQFTLTAPDGSLRPDGWRARLRTNLGRAALVQTEIVGAHFQKVPLAGASWRDIPMRAEGAGRWSLGLPLTEVGYFKAKAYLLDPKGYQHWPAGPDFGVTVHPNDYRTANTIYCAFPRMFGPGKSAATTVDAQLDARLQELDGQGYTVIPPSGKLRDLVKELPHIIGTLGCRIVHLLPVNPTPTTFARFGRFGSPYAIQDLTAIDPALVEFDKRTTGVDQFCELAEAIHARGARLFLDVVINHTGWGATLQENHPEWYLRDAQGNFVSPGAWGNIWADLVELEHKHPALWETIAEAFLVWCRRGVDGFRCDAGYKVPTAAWQYIIARVRQEFPAALFLLEGLGGGWWDTESLLTEGGMQWAYSELFQEFTGKQVAGYLDHALKQSDRVGLLVHYSETHDNLRLAAKGRAWSLFRNRFCALVSPCGGYGFTCGVEWLAPERVNVHSSRGLAWGSKENILPELARLNQLLAQHPCFFDGAKLTRLSAPDSQVYALWRDSAEGKDSVLVLANTDAEKAQSVALDVAGLMPAHSPETSRAHVPKWPDLLGQKAPTSKAAADGQTVFKLPPLGCYCLATSAEPRGLAGDDYRRTRAQSAWALTVLGWCLAAEDIGEADWRELAKLAAENPFDFVSSCQRVKPEAARTNLLAELRRLMTEPAYPRVVRWNPADRRRVTLVPPDHWLLIEDTVPFRATLASPGGSLQLSDASHHAASIAVSHGSIACFPPRPATWHGYDCELRLERFGGNERDVQASLRFLPPGPVVTKPAAFDAVTVLLTNGIGGMTRLGVDLGSVRSKYDCLLGANLHPELPVDRHVFAKRVRVWCNADGFITPLDVDNLLTFQPGPPAVWSFVANAGDRRAVAIEMTAAMVEGTNTTALEFRRPVGPPPHGEELPDRCEVSLTVRVDIEDRNFHWETKHNSGSDHHFISNTRPLVDRPGFEFTPAPDRRLRVFADSGRYHHEGEWSHNLPHPVEQSRGQEGSGDAYSPGWFELPLAKGQRIAVLVSADLSSPDEIAATARLSLCTLAPESVGPDPFRQTLCQAARSFVVRRGTGKTVIAGYPWFLDWGRDTLIAARGLLTAGMVEEVRQLVVTFGQFEEHGTLPNTIHGANASNRDTTDAPLWFGVVCEELAEILAAGVGGPGTKKTRQGAHSSSSIAHRAPCDLAVNEKGRTIADVLRSIAVNYLRGTPNGIRMDASSGLIWSPAHFTWMDTNYPAGTPREGYPIEIQALWIRLLRQLERLGLPPETKPWSELAGAAEESFHELFWLPDTGWFVDVLIGKAGQAARACVPDNAFRSNCLLAISLGLVTGDRARRCVAAALRHLLVPGALRSLAPLPVSPPLPLHGRDGKLLNDPLHPYWGRYEGDEDTRRKPAYHNGTAWTWTFPGFCEALAMAWDGSPAAVAAAKAYLGSMDRLLAEGCMGQLPEIVDGDAPHQQRGCDAQAWAVTEALRVWERLKA